MPFVVSAAQATEGFPIAALSVAMGNIYIFVNSACPVAPEDGTGVSRMSEANPA